MAPKSIKCGWAGCKHNSSNTNHEPGLCKYEGEVELEFTTVETTTGDKDILECKQFEWKR